MLSTLSLHMYCSLCSGWNIPRPLLAVTPTLDLGTDASLSLGPSEITSFWVSLYHLLCSHVCRLDCNSLLDCVTHKERGGTSVLVTVVASASRMVLSWCLLSGKNKCKK